MNVLNIEHISKVFGEKVIFDDVSYGIHDGDKIGIIGINGTGKTTLLKIIAGLEEPDEGQVICQNGLRITYLPQNPEFPARATVLSYVTGGQEKDSTDWNPDSDAKTILNHLGITEHAALISQLSGGQKKRVALAKTLVNPADVLVLDEPTNHIDNEMAAWLEDYLNRFRGIVIMVTHDRYFLDRVTNKILEISHGKLYAYTANYSRFLEMKAEREEMELATERKRQSVLRMELEWAKRGCRARTTKQKARLERLEALKSGFAPVRDTMVEMDSVETRMGKKTIELHHISKQYGDKIIIRDFNYIVLKNQRLGIIGPNGCGKSTLMKIITGVLKPDNGNVEIGETVRIGYFAQEETQMDGRQRVIDYIKDEAEYIRTTTGTISASRMLERFLFTPDMQYTPIAKISGGERRRLYLLKILMSSPNVLILDEPTNNLDIATLQVLESFLDTFLGIVIVVSHDRYFLERIADRIAAFEDGQIRIYEGGYMDYLEKKWEFGMMDDNLEHVESGSRIHKKKENRAKEGEKTRKKGSYRDPSTKKLRFTYMEQKEFDTIDEDIAVLEGKIENLEGEISRNATDFVRLNELVKEKEEAEAQLEEKMDRWVYLNDLAERIKQQKK